MAAQIVLSVGLVMTLVKPVGIAAVGEAVELPEQAGVEGAAGQRVVDRLAVGWAARAT